MTPSGESVSAHTMDAEATAHRLESPQGLAGRMFGSLKVRDFRFFITSSFAQTASMNMQGMVNGWLAYELTGSKAILGITTLGSALPQLSLSLFGGILADRLPKKLVLSLGMAALAVMTLFVAISISLGIITWHYLLINSVIQGIAMALTMPSRQALVSEIVGRDKVTNAVSLNASVMNFNQIAGPAIAGVGVAVVGIAGVYYLMAILFLIAAVAILPVRRARTVMLSKLPTANILASIKDGLLYVRRSPVLLNVLLLSLFTVLLTMPFRNLLPVFAKDVLHVGPSRLGLLLSVSGAGALAGSLIIASLSGKGRGMLFLHTGLLAGISIIVFTFSKSYVMSLVVMTFTGLGQAGRMTLANSLVQSHTEDAYLGRVMSLLVMQMGITGVGVFIVSIIAQFAGAQIAVAGTAGLLVLITMYYYFFTPVVRKLD